MKFWQVQNYISHTSLLVITGLLIVSASTAAMTVHAHKVSHGSNQTTVKLTSQQMADNTIANSSTTRATPNAAESTASASTAANKNTQRSTTASAVATRSATNQSIASKTGVTSPADPVYVADIPPTPYQFSSVTSGLTRTDGANTITYSGQITITPTIANFGTPTITVHQYQDYGPCTNTSDFTRTFTYSGTNVFNFSCVVKRIFPYNNSGNPADIPPLPSDASFKVEMYGNRGASFIYGQTFSYVLHSGYDR